MAKQDLQTTLNEIAEELDAHESALTNQQAQLTSLLNNGGGGGGSGGGAASNIERRAGSGIITTTGVPDGQEFSWVFDEAIRSLTIRFGGFQCTKNPNFYIRGFYIPADDAVHLEVLHGGSFHDNYYRIVSQALLNANGDGATMSGTARLASGSGNYFFSGSYISMPSTHSNIGGALIKIEGARLEILDEGITIGNAS